MKSLKQTYLVNASVETTWNALVDPLIIEKWGGGPAQMNDKVGQEFSLWGGDIYGKNIYIKMNRKLVQDWYGGKWDKPSQVTFTLSPGKGQTQIDLDHINIPDSEFDSIKQGWKVYYLGPLQKLFK